VKILTGFPPRLGLIEFCPVKLIGKVAAFRTKRATMLRRVMALALLLGDAMETPMENDLEPMLFLTLQQTAELLRLSRRTVMRMVQQKKLPAFKVGGQWRVNERRLSKWMQGLQEL